VQQELLEQQVIKAVQGILSALPLFRLLLLDKLHLTLLLLRQLQQLFGYMTLLQMVLLY
jgi:hypothetical protein